MRRLLLSMLCLLLSDSFLYGQQPPPSPEAMETPAEPQFQVYCSATDPGVSVAEIQWPVVAQGPNIDVNAAVQTKTLDVTVYKDGFERGLFKTLQMGGTDRVFSLHNPQAPEIPGLQNLTLTGVTTSKERREPNLRLQAVPLAGYESAVVRVTGLEAGMNYFWRMASLDNARERVSFTAPICPVDRPRAPSKKSKGPANTKKGDGR